MGDASCEAGESDEELPEVVVCLDFVGDESK